MKRQAALIAAAVLLLSCRNSGKDRDFERMVNQAKYQYYQPSDYFPNGAVMREPPEGTVPSDEPRYDPLTVRGVADGRYAEAIPVPVTRALLEAGREHYETLCSPCHGAEGDGASIVAHNMTLRRPPSLIAAPVPQFPPGRIYQVIAEGYGLMPAYGADLSVDARWAVVAYVRALERRAAVPLDALPAPVRQRALTELP
jgi:mono/diheme cytochrome c family protein